MAAYIDGRPAGLAAWGYGIQPTRTPRSLFGDAGRPEDYLELCRYFVYDWTPPNTASRFLATTHRILKRYTSVRWLYTYAAGFQGMVGTIYQAANYEYCGPHRTEGFILLPHGALVHDLALWHRYGDAFKGRKGIARYNDIVPGAKRWYGTNYRYIYWLDPTARADLIPHARFPVGLPYPTLNDIEIWTIDADGQREDVTLDYAKQVPIVRLPSTRRKHRADDAPAAQAG